MGVHLGVWIVKRKGGCKANIMYFFKLGITSKGFNALRELISTRFY